MLRATPLAIVSLMLVACGSPGDPGSGDQEGSPYLRCAPPIDDGVRESFKLAPLTVERDGHDMEIRGIQRGTVIIGLLAGIHEPNPVTLRNIEFFLDRFKAAGVQAVVVSGGVGLSESEVDANLGALAAAPVPVLVSPGAQESFDVLRNRIG